MQGASEGWVAEDLQSSWRNKGQSQSQSDRNYRLSRPQQERSQLGREETVVERTSVREVELFIWQELKANAILKMRDRYQFKYASDEKELTHAGKDCELVPV